MIYITKDGETLDYICWIIYGTTKGNVERVLENNPHLANQPVVFSAGIKIELPQIEENTNQQKIKMWQ